MRKKSSVSRQRPYPAQFIPHCLEVETTLLFEDIFRCLEVETKENSPFWNLEVVTFDWKGAPFWKEATEELLKKNLEELREDFTKLGHHP
jgi:hypothetical protein